MAETKIAGIMRAGAFSPNHIGNDAAIFNLVAEQLRKRGCEVNIYTEEQFIAGAVIEKNIINMCREPRAIQKLQEAQDAGALVINSGYGIENCIRERMARIFLGSGIPYPPTIVTATDQAMEQKLKKAKSGPCWIKRADCHSRHKEDVTYVRHPQEAQEILQEFFMRGINRAVINQHIPGELIKFYGIAGTGFFHCFHPYIEDGAKGIDESRTADAAPLFDTHTLQALATRAAETLELDIYGGDCIVTPDRKLYIVDFKDWPTFAPCRKEAAPEIARFILNRIKTHQNR